MDEMFRALTFCLGMSIGIVPLIVSIVLWVKLKDLRQRVQILETRLGDTARQWWNWANGMTAHVQALAPASAAPTPAESPGSVAARGKEPKAPGITVEFRPPAAAPGRPAAPAPRDVSAEIHTEDRL